MAPISSPYDFEAPSYEKAMTGIRSRLPRMMDKEYGVTSRAQTKLVPTMLKLLSGMDIVWENKNNGVVQVDFVMGLVQKSTKNVSQKWRLRIDFDPEDTSKEKGYHVGFDACKLGISTEEALAQEPPWRGHAFVRRPPPHFRNNAHVSCLCGLLQREVQNYKEMTPMPADSGREWHIGVTAILHAR